MSVPVTWLPPSDYRVYFYFINAENVTFASTAVGFANAPKPLTATISNTSVISAVDFDASFGWCILRQAGQGECTVTITAPNGVSLALAVTVTDTVVTAIAIDLAHSGVVPAGTAA